MKAVVALCGEVVGAESPVFPGLIDIEYIHTHNLHNLGTRGAWGTDGLALALDHPEVVEVV
jgi:hypothetical protein